MSTLRVILFPTDFSERTEAAFPLACALARDQGARLVLLYVDPPPMFHGEVVSRRQTPDYEEQLLEALRRYEAPQGVQPEYRLEEGPPAEGICRVAAELPADVIVMATHGGTGLRRLLMGSVAEQVLRQAPCPVLTASSTPATAEPAG
jgi:nucleotide-binding universal stress UspA family protein